MSNFNPLKKLVSKQKSNQAVGIYSCCSANEFVIEAVLQCAKRDNSCALIEATANQVDQNGGYTGMKPADFKAFVENIATRVGFDMNKVFLGGDHLGPLTFVDNDEAQAMELSKELVNCYVSAGFTKIHIDTSMKVKSDDPNTRLSDETIAKRGAILANVCNSAYQELLTKNPSAIAPVYIIGSEVPIPGGAQGENQGVQVTKVEDFKATYEAFKMAFANEGISDVFADVIAIVVQPGVEEADTGPKEYDRVEAKSLMQAIKAYPNIIFEGHSTDYQTKTKLKEMVEDGVGILKVGPGLTFAMREALFALAYMEEALSAHSNIECSNFIDVLEKTMLKDPKNWKKHYLGSESDLYIKRKFSFSDRCRYYLPDTDVQNALHKLIRNLESIDIPLSLLSQFMPIQYTKVREGALKKEVNALIVDRIVNTIDEYLYATDQGKLLD